MALFGSKKTKKKEEAAIVPAVVKSADAVSVAANSRTSVIIRPHITEKAGLLTQTGTYTFQVARGANKNVIAQAITALYKVSPVKVAIINGPSKRVFVRGKRGVVSGIRKAMVTLKKGDKIDFV